LSAWWTWWVSSRRAAPRLCRDCSFGPGIARPLVARLVLTKAMSSPSPLASCAFRFRQTANSPTRRSGNLPIPSRMRGVEPDAPDGSGLLMLAAASVQTAPDGSRPIVWMIIGMIQAHLASDGKSDGKASRPRSGGGFAELVRRDRRSRGHPALVGVLHAFAAVLLSLASWRLGRPRHADGQSAPRSRDLGPWCRGRPGRSVDLGKGWMR
jgi:hypothetical protein